MSETQPGLHRYGDLEINQDLAFEKRTWVFERTGWALMAIVIVAAWLGLFGIHGMLSDTTLTHDAAPLRLTYNRFARRVAPASLVFEVGPGAGKPGSLTIWLSRSYVDRIQIERITPFPQRVQTGGDRMMFTFSVPESGEPAVIRFDLQTDTAGMLRGEAGLGSAAPLRFQTLVYP